MTSKQSTEFICTQKRKQIERDIEDFLASGGAIEHIRTGLSGDKTFQPNGVADHKPCTTVRVHSNISYGSMI